MSTRALPAKAENLFRYLFEQTSLGIAVEDLDGQILLANHVLCSMLGYQDEELVGLNCSQFCHPDDSQDDWALFQQLRAGIVDHYSLEKRYLTKQGNRLWGRLNVSLLKTQDEASPLVFAFVEDITEHKRAEVGLRENEQRLRLAIQAGRMYAFDWDVVTDVIVRSKESVAILRGKDAEHDTGRDFHARVRPDDEAMYTATEARLTPESPTYQISFRTVSPSGEITWLEETGRASFDSHGTMTRVIGMVADITQRKLAEVKLRQSEERFRLAAQAGKMYAYEWDPASDLVTRSEAYGDIVGLLEPAEQITRQQVAARVHPDDRARFLSAPDNLTPGNPTTKISYRVLRPDGSEVWLEKSARAFFDAQGRLQRLMGMVADITERKQTEEALRQKEEALTEAQRLAGVGNWQWKAQKDEVIWSKEVYHLYGRDPNSPAPSFKDHSDLFTVESWERLRGAVRESLETGTPYELDMEILTPSPTTKWVIARGEALRDSAGQIVGLRGTVQDITQRKHAEQALRESEDKLRLLLDSTAEAIYGVDLEQRCTFCNSAFLRTVGYQRIDDVVGKNMHILVHHTRPDGTPFPIEECRIHCVTLIGEGVHADDELLWRADGTSFRAEYRSFPQRRGQEVVGAVVTFIDITDRKLAEAGLANVSRKLIEAQEQERTRIGRELHDDIVQRLSLLAVELQRLQKDARILPRLRSRLDGLHKRASEIAADAQSLSHELHSARLQYLGVTAAMRGFCREFGEQQKVKVDFKASDLPTALSPDISLCLFRVLQEALHNSAKHSGVGRFEVRLWGTTNETSLTVKDSGKGFDREEAKTNQGIGLISMEERLKMVNGTLSIESQPGRGTKIEARVPVSPGSASLRATG